MAYIHLASCSYYVQPMIIMIIYNQYIYIYIPSTTGIFFVLIVASAECHVTAAAFYNNYIPRSRSSSGVFTFWMGGCWHHHHSSCDTPLLQLCAVTQSLSSSPTHDNVSSATLTHIMVGSVELTKSMMVDRLCGVGQEI